MKKLILLASIILAGCADVEVPAPSINLGVTPTNKTEILSVREARDKGYSDVQCYCRS